jgi:hypothetical protein
LKRRSVLLWPLLGLWPPGALPTPPEAAAREIEYLLGYLGASGCEFYRNGKWFASEKASEHLRKKYDYLVKKKLVASAEQFIERAGTESSQSGKPYRVRCDGQETPSAAWLSEELRRYRSRNDPEVN